MLRRFIPCLSFLAILSLAPPCLAQERTRDAVRPGDCDEASALQGDCQNAPNGQNGHWNADGSYTDSNGKIIDDAGRGRMTDQPADQPYVNWQTSDNRYNGIMNRIENRPGSCLSPEDMVYAEQYTETHHEIWDTFNAHWIVTTKMCPAAPINSEHFSGNDGFSAILNRLAQDPQACMDRDDRRIMESVVSTLPYVWFWEAQYDLSSRFCR